MILAYLYLGCLLFAALMAIYYRKAMRSRGLHIFIPYLVYVFIQEVFTYVYALWHPDSSNAIIYNIYRVLSVCFFAWFYLRIPFNRSFQKTIMILLGIYLLANIITFTFLQSIMKFNNYLYLGGGLMITSFAVFFLFNYFKLDNHNEEKNWLPVVWVTTGIVVFYPVVNISFALYKYLYAYKASIAGVPLYQVIPKVMSFFLYGCFARAFYLCKKKNWI